MAEFRTNHLQHDDKVSFAVWWEHVGSMKSLAQWISKANSLGALDGALNGINISGLGQAMYQHIDTAGKLLSIALLGPFPTA